jgi:hypothetical protein
VTGTIEDQELKERKIRRKGYGKNEEIIQIRERKEGRKKESKYRYGSKRKILKKEKDMEKEISIKEGENKRVRKKTKETERKGEDKRTNQQKQQTRGKTKRKEKE